MSYAQKFAAWVLTKLVTSYWAQIGKEERVQLRNYVLNYLANKGPSLEQYVRLELSTLLCRVTKLGWTDGQPHRNVVDDVGRFLDASEEHCMIGLQVLTRLVSEMNTMSRTYRRSFTHSQSRKVALSFRDLCLLNIFNISLATLGKLSPPPAHGKLRQYGLKLALQCLSFDFVGSSLDESNEDIGTLHPPIAWHTVVEDPNTVKTFVDIYQALCVPDSNQSSIALECLVQLASMRRTLFATDELRIMNIHRHMSGTLSILQTKAGLDDHDNYHHFCRWLARLKVNYQLDEIINLDIYRQWIELVSNFTLQSLASDWSWVGDSLFYLLSLWSRLIAAKPYLKSGKEAYLDAYVEKIVEQYVRTRLHALSQSDDDDDDDDISEHLEAIPIIFRLQYDKTATFLTQIMDPLLENYKTFATSGGLGANPVEVSKLERELAWLTRVIGAVVIGRLNASSSEPQELTDGEVSSRVFQLMMHTVAADSTYRQRQGISPAAMATPAGRARNTKGALALDSAIVDFTQGFRRAYIGEEAVATSKVYVRMAERLGMNDHMTVLNVVATKLSCNLRNYGVVDGHQIIGKSLSLLQDLAAGYSSSRLLCKLATIQDMIANHDEDSFPFMKGPDSRMGRHRTTFYQTLLRILFSSGGTSFDSEMEFNRFMEPLRMKLHALAQLPKEAFLGDPTVKTAIIGVLRDLRGVIATMSNRKTYALFFDWIYPTYTPVLLMIAEVFSEAGVPEVTNVLLKFYAEFIYNKSQRIIFDSSSPNGILLFRETSKILVTYGKHTLRNWERIGGSEMVEKNSNIDAYRVMYKGACVCMMMFARALGGNYVNFGVFSLYGDPALQDAMDICFRLMLAVPLEQLLAYPKVSKAHFGLLEIVCTNHPKDVAKLDHVTFVRIVESLREGLQSHEVWMSSQAASAIDQLAAFLFKQSVKPSEEGRMMLKHVQENAELFPSCLEIIFNMIIHVDCTNQWSLSRPLLSLILTNEEAYMRIKTRTIQAQAPERQGNVGAAFEKLMNDIRRTLESKNRDRFTQQVTQFRLALRTEGVTDRLG